MIYYVRTGSVDTKQIADSHKQAAIETLKKFEDQDFGIFIIVGKYDLDDVSRRNSHMFFSTESLLEELVLSDTPNMRLVY